MTGIRYKKPPPDITADLEEFEGIKDTLPELDGNVAKIHLPRGRAIHLARGYNCVHGNFHPYSNPYEPDSEYIMVNGVWRRMDGRDYGDN